MAARSFLHRWCTASAHLSVEPSPTIINDYQVPPALGFFIPAECHISGTIRPSLDPSLNSVKSRADRHYTLSVPK